jgi:hypothetical protein
VTTTLDRPSLANGSLLDSTADVLDCVVADINSGGKVDLYDAVSMAKHFGCRACDADWDANVDMNGDLEIDMYDVIMLAQLFGT